MDQFIISVHGSYVENALQIITMMQIIGEIISIVYHFFKAGEQEYQTWTVSKLEYLNYNLLENEYRKVKMQYKVR